MIFNWMKKKRLLKIALGIVLVIAGGYFVFKNDLFFYNDSMSMFENEPVKIAQFDLNDIPEHKKPIRIIIPKLAIDLEIQEADIVNGYWDVFDDTAAWGKGSAAPGYMGNQVIFAHAKDGLFGDLDSIKIEDDIYVFNENEWYKYKVQEIKEVYPGETEVVSMTEDETLTLYTCSGFRDQKRLVITAKRAN